MSLTEIASGTWRCESLVGPRNMFQYLIADGDEAIVIDTGMTATPRDVILPGMRAAGIDPGDVRMVVVTHPDLDHQGGLAGLREVLPNAVGACGSPALSPTYEEVDDYLATIDMLESLGAAELHSGHWPIRSGGEIADFMAESRAFVARMDSALEERLARPATLAELCDHADERMGPFGSEPVNLMFVVHGHVRRMLNAGKAEVVVAGERPPRYRLS